MWLQGQVNFFFLDGFQDLFGGLCFLGQFIYGHALCSLGLDKARGARRKLLFAIAFCDLD